jgi:hypothetical protein
MRPSPISPIARARTTSHAILTSPRDAAVTAVNRLRSAADGRSRADRTSTRWIGSDAAVDSRGTNRATHQRHARAARSGIASLVDTAGSGRTAIETTSLPEWVGGAGGGGGGGGGGRLHRRSDTLTSRLAVASSPAHCWDAVCRVPAWSDPRTRSTAVRIIAVKHRCPLSCCIQRIRRDLARKQPRLLRLVRLWHRRYVWRARLLRRASRRAGVE